MKIIAAIAFALCLNAAAQEAKKPSVPFFPSVPVVPAAPAAPAETPPVAQVAEPDSPEKTVARFFASIQRKEVDQAYETLTKGTKIAERAEDVKMLKSKTKDAIAVFGVIAGYDLVAKRNVGERLVSYTYVSLGKEFPLRWRFYFYKPGDSWKLIDLRVDDRLAAIFDEQEDPRTRE
jgi:hypothetical protein